MTKNKNDLNENTGSTGTTGSNTNSDEENNNRNNKKIAASDNNSTSSKRAKTSNTINPTPDQFRMPEKGKEITLTTSVTNEKKKISESLPGLQYHSLDNLDAAKIMHSLSEKNPNILATSEVLTLNEGK